MKKTSNMNIKNPEVKTTISIVVFRSNRAIYGQAFDLERRKIIAASSSQKITSKKPVDAAREVGLKLAEKLAKTKAKFIFNRNGYLYHGQVKALADGLRQGGINI